MKNQKSETREIICIACPVGCHLNVTYQDGGGEDSIKITGNRCPRGEIYGREEILAPTRMVTTTVKVGGSAFAQRVPVRTRGPVPVAQIPELLTQLHNLELQAPLERGQMVYGAGDVEVITSHRA